MRKHHRYSEEEELFLRESISQFDCYADLTAAFNELFDCGLTRQSIQDKCIKRMRICIGKNKAQFRAGGRQRAVPIGTIRKTVNATYIKVSDVATGITGYAAPDWIPLQQKIWEDYNGKMPDGHMICFLDCNKENFSMRLLAEAKEEKPCLVLYHALNCLLKHSMRLLVMSSWKLCTRIC